MGSGSWSSSVHTAASTARSMTGKSAFDFSDTTTRTVPRDAWKVHEELDPMAVNGPASPLAGKNIRESRDSDEHPTSLAIAVLFDETGSMHEVPRLLQTKLETLFGLLLRKGYVEHPQILMGGIGDAFTDKVPLQMGQFESDNRIDDDLQAIFLEANGGGQDPPRESYELAMYFMARHTVTDCWEQRHHRGYLFIIGDESPYAQVNPGQVRDLIGDDLTEPIATEAIAEELKTRFATYLIRPGGSSYRPGDHYGDAIIENWRKLLGPENVIDLEDPEAVCETIALTIGLSEGTIDLDDGLAHLKEVGVDDRTSTMVGKALVPLAAARPPAMASSSGDLDLAGDSGAERI